MDTAGRIQSLDGVRAVSVTMVLTAHLVRRWGSFVHLDLGSLGVRVFFVVSGFLITTLLAREHASAGRISVARFYLRRTLRIFPPFYAFILVMLALRSRGWVTLPWRDVIHAATFTMNYAPEREWALGHTWSLAVEEQFYLLWPCALVVLGHHRGLGIAASVLLLAPLLRLASFALFPETRGSIGETFPTTADALAAGCALALSRERLWGWPPYRRLLCSRFFCLAPLLAIALQSQAHHARLWFSVGASAVNVAIALSLDHVVRFPGSAAGRFLNRPSVASVGVMSYSIYLWQQPFLEEGARSWATTVPRNVILLLGCAFASYHLIERPALRLRAAIEARLAPRTREPGAYGGSQPDDASSGERTSVAPG